MIAETFCTAETNRTRATKSFRGAEGFRDHARGDATTGRLDLGISDNRRRR
jgi:hypothetical protein